MAALVVSPELALVDPDLRARALEALPELHPWDFLRFPEPPPPTALHAPPPRPRLAVAALVYTLSRLAVSLAWGAILAAVLIAAVSLAVLFGSP